MRVVQIRGYYSIHEDIYVDGRRTTRSIISLPRANKEEAESLLKALQDNKVKICVDKFGHKYVTDVNVS